MGPARKQNLQSLPGPLTISPLSSQTTKLSSSPILPLGLLVFRKQKPETPSACHPVPCLPDASDVGSATCSDAEQRRKTSNDSETRQRCVLQRELENAEKTANVPRQGWVERSQGRGRLRVACTSSEPARLGGLSFHQARGMERGRSKEKTDSIGLRANNLRLGAFEQWEKKSPQSSLESVCDKPPKPVCFEVNLVALSCALENEIATLSRMDTWLGPVMMGRETFP